MLFYDEEKILRDCSAKFHEESGAKQPVYRGGVVEVAHQPLFYPEDWFYKKFEVASDLAKERKGMLVWGVMDDDFFLFPRMWRSSRKRLSNRAVNPRRVAFWAIPKPKELTEFPQAKTLAMHNAFVIARELNERGIYPLVFCYSALPLLTKQLDWFKANEVAFREAFNLSVVNRQASMRLLRVGELPLWKINEDGTKETLKLGELVSRVGFKAVAREFALSSFLNTQTYVCGKGAAKGYEPVVDDVAEALNVTLPVRVVV